LKRAFKRQPPSKKRLNASEALYGFVGWLTSRKRKTVMGANEDASEAVNLISEFIKVQKLPRARENWTRYLKKMKN
jgi:hypothetical protein